MLKVIQIRMKLYFLVDIPLEQLQIRLTDFLDRSLMQEEQYAKFHNENRYKNYCFDLCYPVERDKLYKRENIYTLTIRTVDSELARYFSEKTVHFYTEYVKSLTAEVRIIPEKYIDILWNTTPAIMKCQGGYWRGVLSIEQYEKRMKINLLKKWQQIYGQKLEENFELFSSIEFLNKKPIAVKYKDICLLGDKLRLHIAGNKSAQNLAQLAVGTGILENNSRGSGFCNYRWL